MYIEYIGVSNIFWICDYNFLIIFGKKGMNEISGENLKILDFS